jgi:hypothetical protein
MNLLPATPQQNAEFQQAASKFDAIMPHKIHGTAETVQWPAPLSEQAFYGLPGDIVRAISPQTESDPAAILLQVLTLFGALTGRGPHVAVEGDQHHGNLFALIVGETSKARKGTSWSRAKEIFEAVEGYPSVISGLSSGEGLKWRVRDRITKKIEDGKEVELDPGVSDKRLLVVESEFSQVLKQAARAGNTLSPTIRSAWDSGYLSSLTRNEPTVATGAHVAIIGHITGDELRAELTQTDQANGFGNRFVFMCAKRSQVLPRGGKPLARETLNNLAQRIATAAGKARTFSAVDLDAEALATWEKVYPALSEGKPGQFGAITGRAEAQCLRLSLIYALMDCSPVIRLPHLHAALAVWDRSEASVRFVFGNSLGDPVADTIYKSLQSGPKSRTEIRDLFQRHQTAERLDVALGMLRTRGKVRCELVGTEGRATEVWAIT